MWPTYVYIWPQGPSSYARMGRQNNYACAWSPPGSEARLVVSSLLVAPLSPSLSLSLFGSLIDCLLPLSGVKCYHETLSKINCYVGPTDWLINELSLVRLGSPFLSLCCIVPPGAAATAPV